MMVNLLSCLVSVEKIGSVEKTITAWIGTGISWGLMAKLMSPVMVS